MQLPLRPAHCSTIHKAQGTTAFHGIVLQPSRMYPFTMGLEYVGISRATSISNVITLDFIRPDHFASHPFQRQDIANEYARLNSIF